MVTYNLLLTFVAATLWRVSGEPLTISSATQLNSTSSSIISHDELTHNVTDSAVGSRISTLMTHLPTLKNIVIFICVLTAALITCLVIKVIRSGRRIRKTRKYDIITTPAERVEMAPLNEENDDEDDSTLFDVKYRWMPAWTSIFDDSSFCPTQLKWFPVLFVLPSLTISATCAACAWRLSVFKWMPQYGYHCLLLCWRFYQVAPVNHPITFNNRDEEPSWIHSINWIISMTTDYMEIPFFCFFYPLNIFSTLELQHTVCWTEEFITNVKVWICFYYNAGLITL